MKKVLFIGPTKYNLTKDLHLEVKIKGLSEGIKPYFLAKGNPYHKKVWGAQFYLLSLGIFHWPIAFFLALRICLKEKIDIIICQGPLLEGLVGVVLKKLFKKQLIIEMHGDWEQRMPSMKKVLTFFAKISLRNADKVRGVANYLIIKAKKYAPEKPYFLFPTFTDLSSFLNQREITFENYVLFMGRKEKVKGAKYLIDAFEKIKNDFPNFKLVLAGEGMPKGKLTLEEARNKMKSCYCLVIPSLSEGLPRVLLEAMALSKPVIASNVGGIPDLIQDGQNGFLAEPGNSDDLAEKLKRLLSSREMAIEMGKKGRKLIEGKFSNEKYTANYLQMINQ